MTKESQEKGPKNLELASVSDEVRDAAKKDKKDGNNPGVGISATLLDKLFISLSRVGVEYLYAKYPEMTVFQMLLYRAVFATAFSLVWVNV